jgi:hypothetical protein
MLQPHNHARQLFADKFPRIGQKNFEIADRAVQLPYILV